MKRILTFGIALILFANGLIGIFLMEEVKGETKSGYTSHEPIYIDGDSGFVIGQNGVSSGDGSQGNPFVIEGWDINVSSKNGIEIRNTTVYFVIRNCLVRDGYNDDGNRTNDKDGIYFYNVKNGKIENSEIYNNHYGIVLYSSSNNNINSNNIYSNNDDGIILDSYSNNNNINSNNVSKNYDGIDIYSSSNNIINSNNVSNNGWYSIYLSSHPSNNIIYLNNFISITYYQSYDSGTNFWNSSSKGNYWSDYTGTDSNNDGIGDIPYLISGGNNKDNFPLMKQIDINQSQNGNGNNNNTTTTLPPQSPKEKSIIEKILSDSLYGIPIIILIVVIILAVIGGSFAVYNHRKKKKMFPERQYEYEESKKKQYFGKKKDYYADGETFSSQNFYSKPIPTTKKDALYKGQYHSLDGLAAKNVTQDLKKKIATCPKCKFKFDFFPSQTEIQCPSCGFKSKRKADGQTQQQRQQIPQQMQQPQSQYPSQIQTQQPQQIPQQPMVVSCPNCGVNFQVSPMQTQIQRSSQERFSPNSQNLVIQCPNCGLIGNLGNQPQQQYQQPQQQPQTPSPSPKYDKPKRELSQKYASTTQVRSQNYYTNPPPMTPEQYQQMQQPQQSKIVFCPNCNTQIQVMPNQKQVQCPNCGTSGTL